MELGKFITELIAPKIQRSDLLSSVDDIQKELLDLTLPPYKTVTQNKVFNGSTPFHSSPMKQFNRRFQNETRQRDNCINAITLILSNLTTGFPILRKQIEQNFKSPNILKDGLTYKQGTILRVISLIEFALLYSRRLFIYMLGEETPIVAKKSIERPFSKAEIKWIEENSGNYCRLMAVLSKPMSSILEIIDTIPDVVYNPAQEVQVNAAVGRGRLDPLKIGFIPVVSDLFMFFGKIGYEHSAKKFLKNQEELNDMQLRLDMYRDASNGEHDAAQEKLIKITEERVTQMTNDLNNDRERMGI